ncbi:hypothetical protein [Streptomyces sp. NPDC059176]|uniref:hypothetical protein n=1 Tax=unclassified Streptomyces TaxID=2593676 RepID=UPI00369CC4B8
MTRTEVLIEDMVKAHAVVPLEIGGLLLRALGLVDREHTEELATDEAEVVR